MTASGDNPSESDNSTSRTTTDAPPETTNPRLIPIAEAVEHYGGWITRERLTTEFAITRSELDDHLAVLEDSGIVERADLGRVTLIHVPNLPVQDAIAELSDCCEAHWRQEHCDG